MIRYLNPRSMKYDVLYLCLFNDSLLACNHVWSNANSLFIQIYPIDYLSVIYMYDLHIKL